nr:sugar phosphate isomerase/epimerase [uncultured Acetatifactor sp.]
MNIICSPAGIMDPVFPGQGVLDMAGAGFENTVLDLTMYCSPGELEDVGKPQTTAWKRKEAAETERKRKVLISEEPAGLSHEIKPFLEKCAESRIEASVAIAPCLKWTTRREELEALLTQLVQESIRVCGQAGIPYLVVQPLFSGVAKGEEWEKNRGYFLELAGYARENGVQILLQNQCRDINGHLNRGICSAPEEAADWIDRLNREAGEERFGFCMDVGTYNLCGQNMREAAVILGRRVKAVILRDCNGRDKSAMLPFTCVNRGRSVTDWLGLIRGLRETGFDGELILHFEDTACAFSPLLRPELMRLAKAAAEYFRWQIGIENFLKKYDSVVLFGAGRMCRNYMKYYGDRYQPLYTCDNNPELWGAEVCGLPVKNPESLKELPENCAILICNIFYREIEQQLREMGVGNPIDYFNDEYM